MFGRIPSDLSDLGDLGDNDKRPISPTTLDDPDTIKRQRSDVSDDGFSVPDYKSYAPATNQSSQLGSFEAQLGGVNQSGTQSTLLPPATFGGGVTGAGASVSKSKSTSATAGVGTRGSNKGKETSPFRGVSRSARASWRAKWNRKPIENGRDGTKGSFTSPLQATLAYDKKVHIDKPEKWEKMRNFRPESETAPVYPDDDETPTERAGVYYRRGLTFENPLGLFDDDIRQIIISQTPSDYASPFGSLGNEMDALIASIPEPQKNDPIKAWTRKDARTRKKAEKDAKEAAMKARAAGAESDAFICDEDEGAYRSLGGMRGLSSPPENYDDEFGSDEEWSDSEVYHSDDE
jgi:hypothetical protein